MSRASVHRRTAWAGSREIARIAAIVRRVAKATSTGSSPSTSSKTTTPSSRLRNRAAVMDTGMPRSARPLSNELDLPTASQPGQCVLHRLIGRKPQLAIRRVGGGELSDPSVAVVHQEQGGDRFDGEVVALEVPTEADQLGTDRLVPGNGHGGVLIDIRQCGGDCGPRGRSRKAGHIRWTADQSWFWPRHTTCP